MMRWVFAALVLANIGILMWATWYRGDAGSTISPRPVFHPELMVPISSPGVTLKSRRQEKASSPLVPAKPKMRCVRIGPLSADAAEPAGTRLLADRVEHLRQSETRKVENSYWVHLGPFEDRKLAEKRMKELGELGVRDLLIMQDSEGRVAISLGLFSQADNAGNRLKELSDKGITARQEIRYKSEEWFWFYVRIPEPAEEAVTKLRGQDWGAGATVQDQTCPVTPAG